MIPLFERSNTVRALDRADIGTGGGGGGGGGGSSKNLQVSYKGYLS
jgi:hypothetical protein